MTSPCTNISAPRPPRTIRRHAGLSYIELLVTVFIAAIVAAAVLSVLRSTTQTARTLDEYMTRLSAAQHALDLLIDDFIAAAAENQLAKLDIKRQSLGWRETAHLTMSVPGTNPDQPPARTIDWIAVPRYYPRYDLDDLVLFRREKRTADPETAYYVPLCEFLYSFSAEQLNLEGQSLEDPNAPTPMIQITAQLYQPGPRDPDRVLTLSRTFCLRRFD